MQIEKKLSGISNERTEERKRKLKEECVRIKEALAYYG